MVEGPQGPRVVMGGIEVLLLCSNNYLGLADHPRVREAAAEAAERFGAGAGASRLISGSMGLHRTLERRLAEFKGSEAALAFGSGYLANIGTVSALAGRGERRLLRRAEPRQRSSTAAGSPAPRPSSTATATSSTSPGASSGPAAGPR